MKTANPDIPNIPITPDVATQLSPAATQPLVLFPVRLETRFFPLADGGSEFRVRVYPDNVHLDTHEPGLTDEEITWGKHFWEQTWVAEADEERAKAAWRQLADRFDPPRAAWIALSLKPPKPHDPFPTTPRTAEPWTRAPLTRLMPNFWILLGYKNGRLVVNTKGGPIREPLAAGPDPSTSAVVDDTGIDAGMKWMIDFNEAEAAGMGIRTKLTKEVATAGFDFLLVMGIKDPAGSGTDATTRLTEVFKAHRYTDGMSFVPPGTPSNNTTETPSGFSSEDPGHEVSYQAERAGTIFKSGDRSNADVLTAALGLTQTRQVFANLEHATDIDQLDAQNMNRALWQATWGYFLLQMLGVGQPGESPLSDDDIEWARRHFAQYVRATGPLPSVRIGKQPYGFLPVTSLNAWKASSTQSGDDTLRDTNRDVALRDFLLRMRDVWRRKFPETPRLGRSDDTPQQSGIDKDLTEVLSMDALSSHYSMRNLLGRQYLEHLWIFLSADFFKDVWHLPEIEPPPVEEPPTIDETPEHFTKAQKNVALRKMMEEFNKRQQAAQRAFERAVAARQAFLKGKRDSLTFWWTTQEQRTTAVLQGLGLTSRPRLARATYSGALAQLNGPLVQADQSPVLAPNYIKTLLDARDLVKDIRFRNLSVEQPPPHTLLHLLLRHSMLLEYTNAATRLLIKRNLLQPALRREPELIDMPVGQLMVSIWRQMVMKIPVTGEAAPVELSRYLLGFLPTGEPDVAREPDLKSISEFRASLGHLQSLNVEKLERLLTGTLDLCSHRLDAWITSFATKRLAQIRATNANGVLVGGYGWVMNLKPADAPPKVTPPPGEQEPVFQPANNPGFVHTPSLAQASTVAILRSAHLAHAGADKQKPNDLLAVDLSSERVRLASWLLDGVRQGQPLGGLLGYRFERRLQEAKVPQFIAPFRELAPLVAGKLNQPGPGVAVEAVAANNVVDGLALMRRWQKGKSTQPQQWTIDTIPFGGLVGQQKTKLPPFDQNNPNFKTVQAELNLLEQTVDAVSDALMAESVYHVVRGNPLRAANTVESIAGGETPPPELEVVETPRTGVAHTHRLIALFGGEAAATPPGWEAPAHPFRSAAEPHLNAWAARLLGNPANVRCLIEQVDPASEKVIDTKEVRLDQLRLAPLDFIYAVEGGQGQQAEIEQRILFRSVRMNGGFPPGSLLRIIPNRKPEWKTSELGYAEFSELLRTVRKLFGGLRAIGDDDLNPPERNAGFGVVIKDLTDRAQAARKSLEGVAKSFDDQLAPANTANLETLRELMLKTAAFGLAGAVPLSATGNSQVDRETLLAQAQSIRKELSQRVGQLPPSSDAPPASDEAKRDRALAELRIVFGKSFVVLPRFTASNAPELQQALADSTKIQDGDPLASATWFGRVARVRDGVARLNAALSYSEALNNGERLKLTVAQLPFSTDDRWVALPLKAGQTQTGKLSLAIQSVSPVNVQQPVAGVLIDEWVEVVPGTTEITGVALQFDQPNAAPPQTILVAVPPEIGQPWTIWSLQQVLLETLDLARVRAIDSEGLDEVGHYLPALYFAFNVLNETVSTDFTTIK